MTVPRSKSGIDVLRAHYIDRVNAADESHQADRVTSLVEEFQRELAAIRTEGRAEAPSR
jgi:hypothetical protein